MGTGPVVSYMAILIILKRLIGAYFAWLGHVRENLNQLASCIFILEDQEHIAR